MPITDEFAREVWFSAIKDTGDSEEFVRSQFSLEDLNGARQISTRLVPTEDGNPRFLRVVDYEDGRSLVWGEIGNGGSSETHAYLVQSGRCLYSSDLFEVPEYPEINQ